MTTSETPDSVLTLATAALGRVVGARVKAIPRERWQEANHPTGEPVLLDEPFGPHLGINDAGGYQFAVASAAPHAPEAGVHYLRTVGDDSNRLWKVYSVVVIEDLRADAHWPDVVRIVGSEHAAALEELAQTHVFTFIRLRADHHNPEIPEDIRRATRKSE